MVHPIVAAAVLTFLGVGSVRAQIDLTPKESFYTVEGIQVPNVTFKNGTNAITYTPPSNWLLSGGGSKLTMAPRDGVQSGATIEVQTAHGPVPAAAPENVKVYSDMAVGLVPREASKVEVVEAIVSSMRISGKPMIDVTLTYTFFGQPFRMNVLFMPRERETLRFQFSSRVGDYPVLAKDFRSSLFSIQGL